MLEHDRWQWGPFERTDTTGEFSFKKLFAHPGPLKVLDRQGARKRVCIIGGGIAGLSAAYELGKLNHEVKVVEASERWGGRILTHYFRDGTYGEFGAMRIPPDHDCVNHYVQKEFNLKTREFVSSNSSCYSFFRGVRRNIRDWRPIAQAFGVRSSRQKRADSLFEWAISGFPVSGWEHFANRLVDNALLRLEKTSLYSAVCGSVRGGLQLSPQEWEYVGRMTHAIWVEELSLLHNLREIQLLTAPGKYEIQGGMYELVKAFLDMLSSMSTHVNLRLNERVIRVAMDDKSVVVTSQGSTLFPRNERFDYVICTAPAPATTRIDFGAAISSQKVDALRSLTYMAAAKTLMRCRQRHWELKDGIYGGNSITDLPIQQCWYPSDNSRPSSVSASNHLTTAVGISTVVSPLILDQQTEDWEVRDPSVSQSPGVFLAAYMWGTNARRFAALNSSDQTDLAIRSVANLHPDNEKYLEDVEHYCWDVGGGAFASFAPGQQSRYQQLLCEPLLDAAGSPRVFFAGEHLAVMHGWIQGAIQTALAATSSVISM